jgi:hypothetical protein
VDLNVPGKKVTEIQVAYSSCSETRIWSMECPGGHEQCMFMCFRSRFLVVRTRNGVSTGRSLWRPGGNMGV